MVSPKDNDGVVRVGTVIESFDDATNAGIGIRRCCQIGAERLPKRFRFGVLDVVSAIDDLLCTFPRNVIEVVLKDWRKLDTLQWVKIEVLLRDVPR